MLGRSITDTTLYQPAQVVNGAARPPLPVAAAEDRRIAPEALAAAQAYSDALSGVGLAVWRGDALEHEAYRPDAGLNPRWLCFSLNTT